MDVRVSKGAKFVDGLLASFGITSSKEDMVSLGSKLADNFLADTFVGTGDKSGFLGLDEEIEEIKDIGVRF